MPSRKHERRSKVRTTIFEFLEYRQLMAADLTSFETTVPDDGLASDIAPALHALATNSEQVDQTGEQLEWTDPLQPTVAVPELVQFETEEQAIDQLCELAVKQFENMLGQPILSYFNDLQNGPLSEEGLLEGEGSSFANEDSGAELDYASIQTQGVDKDDTQEISSDGFVFAERRGTVFIIDANDPSRLNATGRFDLNLEGFRGATLHLVGDRLVSVGTSLQDSDYSKPITTISILDVSERSTPKLVERFVLEGFFTNSRLVNGKLFLSGATDTLPAPILVETSQGIAGRSSVKSDDRRFETKEEYLARIRPILIDYVSPNYQATDAEGKVLMSGKIGDWKDLSWIKRDSYALESRQTLLSIDVEATLPAFLDSETILSSWGQAFYVTSESVYLVFNSEQLESEIIKIDFDSEHGELNATATATVPGVVLNSRFMNEFDWDTESDFGEGDTLMQADPVVDQASISMWPPSFEASGSSETVILKHDTTADSPVNELASISNAGAPGEEVVVDETLFVFSAAGFSTHAVSDPSKQLDYFSFYEMETVETVDNDKESSVRIWLEATRDDGTPLNQVGKGDEMWISVVVLDTSEKPEGVFAAYLDLGFDTSAFEILGAPQHSDNYRNGRSGIVTVDGWMDLGGFSSFSAPIGPEQQTIVRFRIRALEDKPLTINASATNVPAYGIAVYGRDTLVPKANLDILNLFVPAATNGLPQFDVNRDGLESSPDSPAPINHLDCMESTESEQPALAESSFADLDLNVNQDEEISVKDVLALINPHNDNRTDQQPIADVVQTIPSSASPTTTSAVTASFDSVFTADFEWQSNEDLLAPASSRYRTRRIPLRMLSWLEGRA